MRRLNQITDIQQNLNQILIHFDGICRQYGLRYYLSNGTLLGAVKYGGFIPWDDDVDVFMPRKDYNRLMELVETDTERYKLLSCERDARWRLPFAKLTDTHTVLEEAGADFGIQTGLSIDVFPLDQWGDNHTRAEIRALHCHILKRLLCASNAKTFVSPRRGIKRGILWGIWACGHLAGHKYLLKQIQKQSMRVRGQSSYCGCVVWTAYNTGEVLPSEVFQDTAYKSFCGGMYPVPCGYETYLTHLYGDYRRDPPVEKQKSNHDIVAWSIHE